MKTVSPSHSVDGRFRSTSYCSRIKNQSGAFLSLFLLIADVYAYFWLAAFAGMGKWLWLMIPALIVLPSFGGPIAWIFIEHAIGGMKRYKLLVHVFRNSNADFENGAVSICAGLWNFALSY